MSEVWNKVYKSDSTFFGEEPSNFALLCFNHMKNNNVKKVLEKKAKEKRLPIKPRIFDVKKNPLPFQDGYFDAIYSHMLLNMRFSLEELHFIFSEIRRVLKHKGWNFFSVRNHNDKSYGKGVGIDKGIYDINGFQIRFFTKKEIKDLAATTEGFEIIWIKEEFEEPVTLYLVSSKKP